MNATLLFSCCTAFTILATDSLAANWPTWRGPNGDGKSPERNFPVQWNQTHNVRWRVDLPDRGNSSPVLWGNKLFVTQAIEKDGRRMVMCFDRTNGRLLWDNGITYREAERTHKDNPYCPSSPVTDGQVVIATYASAGLYAYDLNGKELWHQELGKQNHEWGGGSSPLITGDLCLLYHGPGPGSYLAAFDKKTGKPVWKVNEPAYQPGQRYDGFAGKDDGAVGTWSSPLLIRHDGREELVMSFAQQIRSYAPKTGELLWHTDGLNPLVYTSAVYGEGVVVAAGGFFGSTVVVKPGKGDLSKQHVWYEQRMKKHRIGTGVIHNGHHYVINTIGVAECLELTTGKSLWEERLTATGPKGEVWASFVLAGDKLYTINQSGDTFVIRASPKYELLATNPLGELSNSTPALSDGEIFLRTHKGLWCVSEKKTAAALK